MITPIHYRDVLRNGPRLRDLAVWLRRVAGTSSRNLGQTVWPFLFAIRRKMSRSVSAHALVFRPPRRHGVRAGRAEHGDHGATALLHDDVRHRHHDGHLHRRLRHAGHVVSSGHGHLTLISVMHGMIFMMFRFDISKVISMTATLTENSACL